MASNSFEELNKHFLERLKDDDTYLSEKHSFLKIFQHGIIYDLNQSKNKTLRTYFHLPIWIQRLYWFVRAFQLKDRLKPTLKSILFLDPGRAVEDKETNSKKSYFFEKLKNIFPNIHSVINIEKEKNALISFDFLLSEIAGMKPFMDRKERAMFHEVNVVAQKLLKSKRYTSSEKKYILSALHVFFDVYRKYYFILSDQKVKKCYFIAHYHNEGLIAALEDCAIETIELQHGLISANDLYYCYNGSLKEKLRHAFFPNKIILFGRYWCRVLEDGSEFESDQLLIGGNFILSPELKNISLEKENIVLVAAQKKMTEAYRPLISSLLTHLKNHPDWKLVLKLHPLETDKAEYEKMIDDTGMIAPSEVPLSEWLQKCKIQVSIYSTTFFDAAGYQIMNFAWQEKGFGSDYAEKMVSGGIAEPLYQATDPIDVYETKVLSGYSFISRDEIFGAFNTSVFE